VKTFTITVSEGGKTIAFSTANNADRKAIEALLDNMQRSPEQFDQAQVAQNIREIIAQSLRQKVLANGLNVEVSLDPEANTLSVRHKDFGSKHTFLVSNNVPGVLAVEANQIAEAVRGRDVEGTIDGVAGVGDGENLMASKNTDAEGLSVRFNSVAHTQVRLPKYIEPLFNKIVGKLPFTAEDMQLAQNPDVQKLLDDAMDNDFPFDDVTGYTKEEDGQYAVFNFEAPAKVEQDIDGYAHVTQNSLTFQVGPTRGQQVKISLVDAKTDRLGMGIDNESGFRSLREINVTTPQGAQDALLLIDEAITQISSVRASLGAFQKNTLESNASSLRIAQENLTSAESSLRDADMAQEVSDLTKNQIMFSAGMAMLAQANQSPQSVLQLLNGSAGA
ncbi:MAG: hypothetical protein HY342_02760, partial [Candidatus Lambdaproteobacteria bacterium]|nr:hypothetical protein [Candidatus Lambdaproteobacteria bacterium]